MNFMKYPSFNQEKKLWKKGYQYVIGLDEVGRGALAGPVVAAAVMINSQISVNRNSRIFANKLANIREIKDSKQLTPKQREKFYKILTTHPIISWGIAFVSEKIIDEINVLEATKIAMINAINDLNLKQNQKTFLLVDGNFKLNFPISQKSIVKADEKIFSCTCASVIAKITRDRIMEKLDKKYPQYGFKKHKGYGTKLHFSMIKKYGPCKIHRKTFAPIKNF